MATHTTYSAARADFASLWDQVVADREPIIISRRGSEDVALISAAEPSSLMETAHLLRSPANAERLLTALQRARVRVLEPERVEDLRRELGLEPKG